MKRCPKCEGEMSLLEFYRKKKWYRRLRLENVNIEFRLLICPCGHVEKATIDNWQQKWRKCPECESGNTRLHDSPGWGTVLICEDCGHEEKVK